MTDSETDQLYVAKSASSRSDVEVTVLGCATERKLRIFSMAGDCILERTHQDLKAYNRVSDLINMLCQMTGHKPCRLVLLDGRTRLQPSQAFKGLWPPLEDFELQLIVVPGPSLDLGRELTLKCPEFLEVRREGPHQLAVIFQRGRLLEHIQEDAMLHHRVTLTTPGCFGELHSTSTELVGHDVQIEATVELQLEDFLNHPMATGFKELKMHYGVLDLDFWARGEFHSHLGGCKRSRPCQAANLRGMLQTTLMLMLYWLVDLYSMVSGIWLAVVMTAEGVRQLLLLLVTLWLPGLVWSLRFQFYSGGRSTVETCSRRKRSREATQRSDMGELQDTLEMRGYPSPSPKASDTLSPKTVRTASDLSEHSPKVALSEHSEEALLCSARQPQDPKRQSMRLGEPRRSSIRRRSFSDNPNATLSRHWPPLQAETTAAGRMHSFKGIRPRYLDHLSLPGVERGLSLRKHSRGPRERRAR